MKQSKRIIYKWISLIIITVLALIPLVGCSKAQETIQPVKNVNVTEVKKSSLSIAVEYAGKITPLEEVAIASKFPGKVELVKAEIGTEVQKGDLLFSLDTKSAIAQLNQSKAAVENARANLVRATDSSVVQQLTQLEASIAQAQLQYENAKLSYDRAKELYEAGAVSKEQLENAETYLKNIAVQLNSAKDNLQILNEKAAPQTAAIASAQVAQAQAAYEIASIQVSDSEVTSPIAGIVSVRNIDEGEFISGGMPAFTVINSKTVIITINVPDRVVEKLSVGQSVPTKITALSKSEFTAVIDTISPAANPTTQAYTVKLRLENSDQEIKPGMLAKVMLPIESKDGIIVVPNEAISVESGIQYVFLVENGKVKKASVSIGISNDKITEITKGLAEGAQVITEGQSFLNDGEAVNIVK